MNNIQGVGNLSLKNKQIPEVETKSENPSSVSFKADREQVRYTQPAILQQQQQQDQFIKMVEKQQKKEKRKGFWPKVAMFTGILAGLAIIASLFISYKGSSVSSELVKAIKECKNPELKKAAINEMNKGHQMCSEKKIRDILELAKLSENKPGMVDLEKAIKLMDEKIVDMPEVKESVLDYLIEYNVNISKGIKNKKPLVFAIDGPAGTGKTTISEVIAEAMGIPYKKIAMGGATGKSVIRGTESQYVGAEAGGIAKGQIDSGSNRVLYLLDEVDKLGKSDQHGSVESALLSLFDDQAKFADDFLGTELDLSQSVFVLTTNEFEKLSTPLKNRVKLIKIKPYSKDTKTKIAKMHLTNELKENKMSDLVDVDERAYAKIAEMAKDQGGRETTRNVKELIRQINTMIGLGEMPKNGKLKIDENFVRTHLDFGKKGKSTKDRILEAAKEGRLLKPEPEAELKEVTAMVEKTRKK